MRKFKIAILTESISSNSGARAPVEIAKNLANLGHQIEIFAYNFQPQKSTIADLKSKKVEIHLLKKPRNPVFARLLPNKEIAQTLKDQNFDFVLLAAFLPFLFSAKLARRKVIKIYMGTQFGAYLENKLPNQNINILDRIANLTVDAFIYLSELISAHLSNQTVAISHYCAEEMERLYRRKVNDVIYLGGNHFPAKFPQYNQVLGTRNQKQFHLLSVSRITPYKGFHILIEVLKSLKTNKRVTLTIAGKKEKSNYFRYLKKIAPKNVLFVTNPSDKQLVNLFQTCNLYLSADRYLFFGLPIVEAAFFKKATIALNYAAAKELIINQKTGLLVTSQEEFIKSLTKLINQPHQMQTLGRNAYLNVEKKFTWQTIALKYQQFFEKWFEKPNEEKAVLRQ